MKAMLYPTEKRKAVLEVAQKLDIHPEETVFHKVFINSDSEYAKLILGNPYEDKVIKI